MQKQHWATLPSFKMCNKVKESEPSYNGNISTVPSIATTISVLIPPAVLHYLVIPGSSSVERRPVTLLSASAVTPHPPPVAGEQRFGAFINVSRSSTSKELLPPLYIDDFRGLGLLCTHTLCNILLRCYSIIYRFLELIKVLHNMSYLEQ